MEEEDQKQLGDMLTREIRFLTETEDEPKFDRDGLRALKARLASESRLVQVK